jgi:hypothetical protein
MKRTSLVFVASATLSCAAPVLASTNCKDVAGHFEAVVVPPGEGHCPAAGPVPAAPPPFCTAGRVWGGIKGNYQFVMTGALPAATLGGTPTVLFFTGKSVIFLKKGDQLFGTDTGALDPPPAGQRGFASLITFDGGTGEMSAASGQIRLRGELGDEGTSGDYLGQLCTP